MPTSSVAVRGFALALLGLGAAQASAQVPNVTAFNPYSGIGLPGGPVPQYGPQAAYPIVDTVGPGPAGGPAFNPWRPGAAGGPAPVYPTDQAPVFSYNPGAYLPPPPPGPIESRIVAIPERGDAATSRGRSAPAPDYVPPTPPMAAAPVAPRPEPAPTPPPAPAVVAPPPPAAVPAPVPPARPPVAAAAAPVPEPPAPPPAKGSLAATVAFASQSAELNDAAKTDLDRLAKNLAGRGVRQIEVRAYAGAADPESRKVSLARALVVRSYLIDQGVKSRIEVGSFSADGSGGGERVDILVPNS